MAQSKDRSESQDERYVKTRVPLSSVVSEIPAEGPPARRDVPLTISSIGGRISLFQPRRFAARLVGCLLGVVCVIIVAFLAIWWLTRPSLAEVQSIFGSSAAPKDVVDTLRELRRDHFDQFRDLFQLVVLSGLVPLLTLLAGYAFGTREMEKQTGAERKEEE